MTFKGARRRWRIRLSNERASGAARILCFREVIDRLVTVGSVATHVQSYTKSNGVVSLDRRMRTSSLRCLLTLDSLADECGARQVFSFLTATAHQLSFSYPESTTLPPAVVISRSSSPARYRW
jgi:hypothetical protein